MGMNPGLKMYMLTRKREDERRSEYADNGERRMIGFDRRGDDMYKRRADDRQIYDRRDDETYKRRADDRQIYDRRGDDMYDGGNGERMQYTRPFMPPIYPMENRAGNAYGDVYAHGTIYAPNAMNRPETNDRYRKNDDRDMYRVDEHKAREWVRNMYEGEKFPVEQTEQQRAAVYPDGDKWEFYVAMNAMYDYAKTAKKYGLDKPEFYACLAKDFIADRDAGKDKVGKYMTLIPK